MIGRFAVAVVLLAIGAFTSSGAIAQQLYAASVRSLASTGAEGIAGGLYTVNLATGSATFVAPIKINGVTPIGVTGLASHPATGVFYGITSPLNPGVPQSLVTLDANTGKATLIGGLKFEGSDIAFNRAGILYTWLPATSQLGLVNLETGAVTPIGPQGLPSSPAGLAIDANGVAYITPKGAAGTLDTVDIGTGVLKTGPPLTGAPFPSVINSMTFTPSGLLLAVNSNAGAPADTRLVTINTATGAVSNIGTLPHDSDALTFATGPSRGGGPPLLSGQSLALVVLGVIALILGLVGFLVGRRPKPRDAP
jgi:hypothetical protein